jgi:hypothetical protein
MLSLQSFLREGRVVGPCWEKLKPKGPKGSESINAFSAVLSTEGHVVGLCWAQLKPQGPKGVYELNGAIPLWACSRLAGPGVCERVPL